MTTPNPVREYIHKLQEMDKHDQIIAKIQALPILQQFQFNALLAVYSCSTLSPTLEELQAELNTSVPPQFLAYVDQLVEKEDGLRQYRNFVQRIASESLEAVLDPIHQLEFINQLLQEIQNSEQLKQKTEQHPEALNSLYSASDTIINLGFQLVSLPTNGQTPNSIPTNQQYQEAST